MSLDLNTARKLVSSITRAGNDGSWREAVVRKRPRTQRQAWNAVYRKMQQNPIQNGRKRQTDFSSHASIAASFTGQTGSRYAESQAVHSHSPTTYPFFRRRNEKFPRKRADQWAVLADRRHHGSRCRS
jgi:hypothetical protein